MNHNNHISSTKSMSQACNNITSTICNHALCITRTSKTCHTHMPYHPRYNLSLLQLWVFARPYCCNSECSRPYCCNSECLHPSCCNSGCLHPYCCNSECLHPYCCNSECPLPYFCNSECSHPYCCNSECMHPYCCNSECPCPSCCNSVCARNLQQIRVFAPLLLQL
jgi:hypothetical protein